jgi:hypothetical protein
MKTRPSKRFVAGAVLALSLTLAAVRPRPAQAINVAAAIAALEKAYSAYKALKSFFFDPSMADQLKTVVNDLVTYMNTQRDLQWVSAARSAAADLAVLSRRQPSDPSNPTLFNNIWTNLSTNGIDIMYTVLRAGNDPTSSHQTAPVINQMASAWIGLNMMKGQIWPGFPAAWGDYQDRVQKVMDLDYFMVGARLVMCYPGYNPGRGNYNGSTAVNGQYAERHFYSHLFRMLGDRPVSATSPPTTVPTFGRWLPTCNLKTDACALSCLGCNVSPNWRPVPSSGFLHTARNNFNPTFNADPSVQIVRAGMKGLMSLGGGNDPGDASSTVLPAEGRFIDPWVYEHAVCYPFMQSAYVVTP